MIFGVFSFDMMTTTSNRIFRSTENVSPALNPYFFEFFVIVICSELSPPFGCGDAVAEPRSDLLFQAVRR